MKLTKNDKLFYASSPGYQIQPEPYPHGATHTLISATGMV
jgi:hypothetical protein